jgi:dihydroorotase
MSHDHDSLQPILIRGGRVIDPAREIDESADVLLVDGVVAQLETKKGAISPPTPPSGAAMIDAEGCIVAPGLIDIHVHFREPSDSHEETIATGSASAINGGFTTVCCMPNTQPPLDTTEQIQFVQERAAAADGARIFPVACGTVGRRGESIAPINELAAAGAIAFSDDGDCIASAEVMEHVLRAAAAADRCFMQHCQDPTLTQGASMNAGPVAQRMGQIGWPAVAEESIIDRDVHLNRAVGCRYHAQHVSSGESAAIIARARADGQPVTGEVSPHHLLLTDEACETLGTNAKMNPPLRTQADIARLKEAVAEGVLTVLATDHAPHPASSKDVGFSDASFGIVGLDCALALYARALIDDGVFDWPSMVAMMSIHPARLTGLDRLGLGQLLQGGPADVTIIDPDAVWTIDVEDFATTGRNCPFHGWAVRGRAMATIVGGAVKLLRDPERMTTGGGMPSST